MIRLTEAEFEREVHDLFRLSTRRRTSSGIAVGAVTSAGEWLYCHGPARGVSPITPNTVFEIGSLTKTVTALALADLAAQGQLSLDAPLARYVQTPLSIAGRAITLRELATHTAGIPRLPRNLLLRALRERNNPYSGYSRDDLSAAIQSVRLRRRGRVRYSSFGYALLGQALEGASGLSYQELVHDRVTAPLGMSSTAIGPRTSELAQGHRRTRPVPPWDLGPFAAAGGLCSTLADMVCYLKACLVPELTQLGAAVELAQRTEVKRGRDEQCLAWIRSPSRDGRWIAWHNGATGGFGSFIAFDRCVSVGIVVLSNRRGTRRFDAASIALLERVAHAARARGR